MSKCYRNIYFAPVFRNYSYPITLSSPISGFRSIEPVVRDFWIDQIELDKHSCARGSHITAACVPYAAHAHVLSLLFAICCSPDNHTPSVKKNSNPTLELNECLSGFIARIWVFFFLGRRAYMLPRRLAACSEWKQGETRKDRSELVSTCSNF